MIEPCSSCVRRECEDICRQKTGNTIRYDSQRQAQTEETDGPGGRKNSNSNSNANEVAQLRLRLAELEELVRPSTSRPSETGTGREISISGSRVPRLPPGTGSLEGGTLEVPGLDGLQHQKSTRNALSGHSGLELGSDSMNPVVTRNYTGNGNADATSSSSLAKSNPPPPPLAIVQEETARIYSTAPPPVLAERTNTGQDYTSTPSYPFRQVTPSASSSFSAQQQPQHHDQHQHQYQHQHQHQHQLQNQQQTSKRIIAEMPHSAHRQPQLQPHTFPRPSYMNDLQAHQGTTTGSFPYELPSASGSASGRHGGGGTAIEVTINPAEEEEGHSHGTLVISKSGRSKYLGRTAASEWLKNVSLARGK